MHMIRRCKYGLMIYNQQDVVLGKSLYLYGEYSEGEVALWRALLKPGAIVFDCGATIGAHAIALGRIVGPQGVVVAYEPERSNYYALAGNIAINNFRNIIAFQQALGEKEGSIIVPELDFECTDSWGRLNLEGDFSNSPNYTVPLKTIDALSLNNCGLIKIDVEGMEQRVLQGAAETIKKCRPFLYVDDEISEKSVALREHIKNLDYEILSHQPPLFNPNNFDNEQGNVFATKKDEKTFINAVSLNLFCYPKEFHCPVKLEEFDLRPVP